MGHWIKNALAIVQGIAQQTFRKATSTSEALSTFRKRLSAIGEAFTALFGDHLVKATIAPLSVAAPVYHHRARSPTRSKATLAIAMSLHELGTRRLIRLAEPSSEGFFG
jgi:hypothetical protein